MALATLSGTAALAEKVAAPVVHTFERGEECAVYYNSGMPGGNPFGNMQMLQRLNDGKISQQIVVGDGTRTEEMAIVFDCEQNRGVWFSDVLPPELGMIGRSTDRFERLMGTIRGTPNIDLSELGNTVRREFGARQSGTLHSRTFAVNGFDFDLSCSCYLH
ncbi:hypothetical protein [Paracoccus aminovorans]|nr:hypothetical protein [Paracoccus aminovorans]